MKIFIIFSAILAISNAFFAFNFFDVQPNGDRIRNVYNSSEGIYETPLDHFSPTDGRFLRLPYVANVQYFEQNGPLFFYIRHTINSGNYSERGLIVDLAKELKGAVIEGQTRYFGDNLLGFVSDIHANYQCFIIKYVFQECDSGQFKIFNR